MKTILPESAGRLLLASIYQLDSAVRCHLDGDRSGDTDYHVVVNGVGVSGEFLAPRSGTGYSNRLGLAAGDTVDFMVGRGADGIQYGSGLKIQATLSLLTNVPPTPPVIFVQPQSQTVLAGTNIVLSVTVTGTPPLTYQWKFNGTNVDGATATVAVTNPAGFVLSDPATLIVLVPADLTTPPKGQTAYWGRPCCSRSGPRARLQ